MDVLERHDIDAVTSVAMAIAAALPAHDDNEANDSDVHPPDLDSHPSPNPSKILNPSLPSPASLLTLSRAYHVAAPPPSWPACLILDLNSDLPLPSSLKFSELPLSVQHQLIVARCLAAQPDGPPGLPMVHLPYQPDATLDPLEYGVFHVPLTPYERNRLLPLALHLVTTTKLDQKLRVPLKHLPNLPFRMRDDVLRALSDLVEDAAAHIHSGVPPVRAGGIRARVPQQVTTVHHGVSATRRPVLPGSGHPLALLRRRAAGQTAGPTDWARMRVLALKEVDKVQASCGEVNVMRFVDKLRIVHCLVIGSKAPTNQRDPGNLVLAHLPSKRVLTPPVHRSFRYVQVEPDHPILGGRFVADVTEAAVVSDNRVIIGAEDGAVTLVDAVTGEVLHEWSPVAHPLELDVYDFAAYAVKDVAAHHVQSHISAAAYPDGSIAFFDTERLENFVFPLRLPGPVMRIVFGHGSSNNYLFVGTARRTQSHRRDAMPAGIYCVNWTKGELEPSAEIPPRPHFPVKNCDVASLALNLTGDLLVAATYSNFDTGKGDGMIRVFQVPELELLREWYAGVADVNVVGFSRYVYAACPDNFTLVYDMEWDGDNPLGVLPHDDASTNVDDMHRSDGVTDAIWHRAASLLVTASAADDTVRFWDVAKLDPNRHGERSRTVRIARDWFPDLDLRDALVHVLHPNHGPVLRLAIAPDEMTLVAGTSSGAVVFAGRPLSDQVEVPTGSDEGEDGSDDAMDVDVPAVQPQPPPPDADGHDDVDPWPRTVLVMPA
ncbi:hypothetical protein GGF31_007946 [Allomyces arbusculus]|nr:hypothetical protein GGF31_007946 [Allomyces arbusculus]